MVSTLSGSSNMFCGKEVTTVSDKEFLDMMILEGVQKILDERKPTSAEKEEVLYLIEQAEVNQLAEQECSLVEWITF